MASEQSQNGKGEYQIDEITSGLQKGVTVNDWESQTLNFET